MTHEFKHIITQAFVNQQQALKCALASVVFLEGSSYRKPGVRMLICENGDITGAVSGGCIEKEIVKRAQSVFKDGKAKVMTYDGRYRLGCEGILYILIEPFQVSQALLNAFNESQDARESFQIQSYYQLEDNSVGNYGSLITFKDHLSITFSSNFNIKTVQKLEVFEQELKPCFKLLIIGGEHDSVKLCSMASLLGWEVEVICSIKDPKLISNFPGATSVESHTPETLTLEVDDNTAVVLMTHNYVQDLKYLLKLDGLKPIYIGILGSVKRREQLQNDLLHYKEDLSETTLERIYSPAGLNIGAITPEEIALSILSEILTVVRHRQPASLRDVTKKINL